MSEKTALNYHGVYPCPICRHGEIANLTLMEAYACNFCQHIFTADLERKIIKMADSQLALAWQWNGRHWKGLGRDGIEMGWGYLAFGIAFVLLPTGIVGAGAYLFPPLPDAPLSWLPLAWSFLAFFSHLGCLIWLALEYYQIPIALYLRELPRRWFRGR